ncbi:MAG: bifunctional pyr operon transcriptional regulator/uracil phosphoribosyltransferase PyrR [Fibrobacterota bacterium]
MKTQDKHQMLDEKGIRRIIDRMAHEILERNKGAENLVLVGMLTRGVVVAKRLAESIKTIEKAAPQTGSLDITFYRDDFRSRLKQPSVKATDIPFSIQDKDVVLVDDVLFTGRTARAALDALNDFGRARTIQLAVLIDRGHRELPIQADYAGKAVTTSPNEEIAVRFRETDQKEGVWLVDVQAV